MLDQAARIGVLRWNMAKMGSVAEMSGKLSRDFESTSIAQFRFGIRSTVLVLVLADMLDGRDYS